MDGVTVIQYLIVRQPNNFLLCGFHLKKYFDYFVLYCNVQTKSDFLLQCWKRPCLFFLVVQSGATRVRRSKDSREKQYFAFLSLSLAVSWKNCWKIYIISQLLTFQIVSLLSSLLLFYIEFTKFYISGIEIAHSKWQRKTVYRCEAAVFDKN